MLRHGNVWTNCDSLRLWLVPLSLSPSCVTRKKTARKKKNSYAKFWGKKRPNGGTLLSCVSHRQDFAWPFLPERFLFTGTPDGLGERGSNRRLRFPLPLWKRSEHPKPCLFNNLMANDVFKIQLTNNIYTELFEESLLFQNGTGKLSVL